MTQPQPLPKRRYGVMYFLDARRMHNPDAWGSCETLVAAYGNAARHVARAELLPGEYRRAVIYDRHQGRIVRMYSQAADGISIKDY